MSDAKHTPGPWRWNGGLANRQKRDTKMDWIDLAIRDLCEIPGRDSPDDAPEMLLVTPDEIRDAFERRLIMENELLDG
jgi:hypothetical protein